MISKKGQAFFIGFMIVIAIGGFIILGVASGYLKLGLKTVSADNFEKNYEWFKTQESAMSQIQSQICSAKIQIDEFKSTYGNNTSTWSSDTNRLYGDLLFTKNGYISKYNSLVSDYNARRASFIKSFGRDQNTPKEYAVFYESQC